MADETGLLGRIFFIKNMNGTMANDTPPRTRKSST
jgi:hypothetical protein